MNTGMGAIDFVVCLLVAALASLSLYLGWYWLALFVGLVFQLIVVNVMLHYLEMPLPRVLIGLEMSNEDPEEPEPEE